MLPPLYPISNLPTTIIVVAPGALAGDEVVPVAPLETTLPAGATLRFAPGKLLELAGPGAIDDEQLDVAPLQFALDAGDEADVPGSAASTLLSDKYAKLASDAERLSYHLLAEQLLDLRAPVYTGTDAEELGFAVVLQINFLLQQGMEPLVKKNIVKGSPSISEGYRDRLINPNAALIVARVTGRQQVRFTPPFAGV